MIQKFSLEEAQSSSVEYERTNKKTICSDIRGKTKRPKNKSSNDESLNNRRPLRPTQPVLLRLRWAVVFL